jgi:hypothetical protein
MLGVVHSRKEYEDFSVWLATHRVRSKESSKESGEESGEGTMETMPDTVTAARLWREAIRQQLQEERRRVRDHALAAHGLAAMQGQPQGQPAVLHDKVNTVSTSEGGANKGGGAVSAYDGGGHGLFDTAGWVSRFEELVQAALEVKRAKEEEGSALGALPSIF